MPDPQQQQSTAPAFDPNQAYSAAPASTSSKPAFDPTGSYSATTDTAPGQSKLIRYFTPGRGVEDAAVGSKLEQDIQAAGGKPIPTQHGGVVSYTAPSRVLDETPAQNAARSESETKDLHKTAGQAGAILGSAVAPELLPEELSGVTGLLARSMATGAGAAAGNVAGQSATGASRQEQTESGDALRDAEVFGGTDLAVGATAASIAKAAKYIKGGGVLKTMASPQLSAAEASAVPPAAEFQPALANTPKEVLQHAADEGIPLTGAQATQKGIPRLIQAVGERSLTGADKLAAQTDASKAALMDSMKKFQSTVDPQGLGASEESAGASIRRAAELGLQQAHESAGIAYAQADNLGKDMAGDLSDLTDFANSKLNVRQPHAAATRPEYQSPTSAAALQDIAGAQERVGDNPSIQSMRNLRTEFWEKGNDYSGNVPDSARALYKQASGIVDSSIMDAAKGTQFEPSFRDASNQWKQLKQTYDTPGAPLYRILQQGDPEKITQSILNRGSVQDIDALKNANMDDALSALKSRVVEDVVRANFRVNKDGLAGYSDDFLNSLFGKDATKELYLKSDIGRRLGYEANPSGTSNVSIAEHQLFNPKAWAAPASAAQASMPRTATDFLPGSTSGTQVLPSRYTTLSQLKRPAGALYDQEAVNQ